MANNNPELDERFWKFARKCSEEWGAEQAELKHFEIWQNIKRCESPIESYMCVALHFMFVGLYADVPEFRPRQPDCWPWHDDILETGDCDDYAYVDVFQQVEVEQYRVDFLIIAKPFGATRRTFIVVECDGHDFHERTKEQAMRDRKRDRSLTMKGFKVFRFTGREIYRDAEGCVREIGDFLYKVADTALSNIKDAE